MGIIKLLDQKTIDKIAAGEVVERPLSIVKELVENSIDAGSTNIEIEIKNGGKSYIRVSDNGCGIEKDDVKTAFTRHATSKISNIEDLYENLSLGFRGEALSSICAISKIEMITKSNKEDVGTRIVIDGAIPIIHENVAAPNGTTIIVEDVFYNTPVRLKFLKSDTAEATQITDIVERLAMCRTDIAFNYILNGKTHLSTGGNSDLSEVIYAIYGRDTYENIIEINSNLSFGSITGYIGRPEIARGNRNRESIFINNRYIRSYTLMKAVKEAYTSFLMQHQYPFFVLKLSVDPLKVDVNVHPSKMEVNFENTQVIYNEIYGVIKNSLSVLKGNSGLGGAVNITLDDNKKKSDSNTYNHSFKSSDNGNGIQILEIMKEKLSDEIEVKGKGNNDYISNNEQESSDNKDIELSTKTNISGTDIYDKPDESIVNSGHYDSVIPETQKVLDGFDRPAIRYIGQAFKTYIIAEIDDKMYIIDQHAAHERINFEKFIKELNNGVSCSQELITPIILHLSAKEEMIINKHRDEFGALGFNIEHFGGTDYKITSTPMSFYKMDINELFIQLIDNLSNSLEVKNIETIKDAIANVACKASIKAGKILSEFEAVHLINELLALDTPFSCPHGRPTMIAMSKYELEKKFKRIV